MSKDILYDIFNVGMYLKNLYDSKNIFKIIRAKLISFKLLNRISKIKGKISPFYEWYSNGIKFMYNTNYTSNNISKVSYVYDSKLDLEVCTCYIKLNKTITFKMIVSIPMDPDINPSMKITICSTDNYFRHIDLKGYNIDHFIDNKYDSFSTTSVKNCLSQFQYELYNACKKYLSKD